MQQTTVFRREKDKYNLGVYLLALGYFSYLYWETYELTPDAALTPRFALRVGILLCILGVAKIVVSTSYFPDIWSDHGKNDDEGLFELVEDADGGEEKIDLFSRSALIYLVGISAYIAAMYILGFFTSTFLFATIHAYLRDVSIPYSLLFGVALTTVFYVVFIVILERVLILQHGILI